jgi:hypothetical protein
MIWILGNIPNQIRIFFGDGAQMRDYIQLSATSALCPNFLPF